MKASNRTISAGLDLGTYYYAPAPLDRGFKLDERSAQPPVRAYAFYLTLDTESLQQWRDSAPTATRFCEVGLCIDGQQYELSAAMLKEVLSPFKVPA